MEKQTVSATATAAAATAVPKSTSTPEMNVAATPPAPAEPEEHVDGDLVDSTVRKLKGTRPDLLRTTTYYEGAKVRSHAA